MTALSEGRNTSRQKGDFVVLPVAAGVKIYEGALVAVNAAGYAVPGAKATGLTAAGRAEEMADNTGGAAGDISVTVARGCFIYGAADITQANILKNCYILDDQTVTGTATSASLAGKLLGYGPDGAIVEIS